MHYAEPRINERAAAMPNIQEVRPNAPQLLQEAPPEQMDAAYSEEAETSRPSDFSIRSRVEDVGRLTSEQTARLVSSMSHEMNFRSLQQ